MNVATPYLVAVVVGWLLAHIVKYTVARIKGIRVDLTRHLFISGGMPSSHAATSVALGTVIGLKDGIDSGLFGLTTLFVLIVCYDAVKVRRSSGEQGEAIKQLIKETDSKVKVPRIAKGHTPLEVFAGALLGVAIGSVVFFATK